jgi:amidohydrolase family protein
MRSAAALLLLVLSGVTAAGEPQCEAPKARYSGAMTDAMAQIEAAQARGVADAIEKSGVSRMALFARMHRKRNGEADVLLLKKTYPERIFMGTPKPFDQRKDLSSWFLGRTISFLEDDRYRFVGEILFAHADKTHGETTSDGERYVAPDGENVAKLLSAADRRRVPVMLHWEVYDWDRDWPGFDALYARFPGVTFIWPHAGFASYEQVAKVLSSHPNVVVTLSKKEKAPGSISSEEKREMLGEPVVNACGRLLAEWRELFMKYPDRFMFATDAHKNYRWVRYGEVVEQWRLILGQLPDPVAQALAWRNAERVYGAAR